MPNQYSNQAVLANPAAYRLFHCTIPLNAVEKSALAALTATAHLAITKEDHIVLRKFYQAMKLEDTPLGNLYKSLRFDEFIERLISKRFEKAYLDGRQIVPRQFTGKADPLRLFYKNYPRAQTDDAFNRLQLLDVIGTKNDGFHIYEEYLSLAELSVSAMVLMMTTDVVIGRGGRGNWRDKELEWYDTRVREIFYHFQAPESALAVVFSYPAGIELRGGNSAALDTIFCLISKDSDSELNQRRETVLKNPALGKTLHGFYGEKSALSFHNFYEALHDQTMHPEDWVEVNSELLLFKPAYQAKMERILRQIILAHDHSMAELGLGRILNLKGLGLGAFGIAEANPELEKIFLTALIKVHTELAPSLRYITGINLINPPSLYRSGAKLPTPLLILAKEQSGVRLTANCMDPTSQYIVNHDHSGHGSPDFEVGGVVFCGDSATFPGNEARIRHTVGADWVAPVGLHPDSSDDPAQMYAMAQPANFDPIANTSMLQNIKLLDIKNPLYIHPLALPRMLFRQIKERLRLPLQTEIRKEPEIKFPDSYSIIYSANENSVDSIRALLSDYTKDNSWLSRVLHGHWNRHHVFEVHQIVIRIDRNELQSKEDILLALHKIQLVNPHGSLSRRIAFIEKQDSVEDSFDFEAASFPIG